MDLPKPAAKPSGGSSSVGSENFLKIGENEKVEVVFRGKPYLFYLYWPNGAEKQIFNEPAPGAKPRYMWNAIVWDKANKKFVSKVWEMAGMSYETLYEINQHQPLEKTKIQIGRKGSGKNTKYTIIPLGPVAATALPAIEAVELHILHREGADSEGPTDEPNDDEIPF